MVRIILLAALSAVVVAAPADQTQADIDLLEVETDDSNDAVNRERKSVASGGSYTICNGGGPPHLHYGGGPSHLNYGGGQFSAAWAPANNHGHIPFIPQVPIQIAPAAPYGYGYGGHYRGADGAQVAVDMTASRGNAGAQTSMDQSSTVLMGEKDQSFLKNQRAAEEFSFQPERVAAQQMLFQQQRAVDQLNQQAAFGKTEQMIAAGSNQAFARNAYGAAPAYGAGPYGVGSFGTGLIGAGSIGVSQYGAGQFGAGSAVGVFPGGLNGGGCNNAIPLLLSCSPNLVQGHVVSHGHGGSHTSNLGINGFHTGIGAGAYSSNGAPGYRAADGASPQLPQQAHQSQQLQNMQQLQQQAKQSQQTQQSQPQQHQHEMQAAGSASKEQSVEHAQKNTGAAAPSTSTHAN